MRYQGKISDWKDDRGFGFITQNGSVDRVFVHISAFADRRNRPVPGELVTYTCVTDEKRGYRAVDVRYVHAARQASHTPRQTYAGKGGRGILTPLLTVMLAGGVGLYAWQSSASKPVQSFSLDEPADVQRLAEIPDPGSVNSSFQCEGKQLCPQMSSCAEATFYLRNCPGTKMDGDGDGVPCESQWCN